jgi:hypothetical protein
MTAIETNITPQKKAKPKSGDLKPGRATDPAIDHVLEPPAGQLRLSSAYHPRMKRTDHERDAQQNAGYQKESRKRKANERPSSIAGMIVADPISSVQLWLSEFEKKQIIEASSPEALAKHGYDPKRILTPREDRDFIARLAEELLKDFFKARLKGRK